MMPGAGTGAGAGAAPPAGAAPGRGAALVPISTLYGRVRVRDSLPYQNSVVSLEGRGCIRMMRGVTDSTTSLLAIAVLRAEQLADYRNVTEARNAVEIAGVRILDQPGGNLRLPVLEPRQRVGVARTDLVSDRARLGVGDLLQDRAHLEIDLDTYVAVQG